MKDIKVCPDIVSATVTSPIGPIVFEVCPLGLMKLKLSPEVTNENFLELASEDIEVIDDKENRKSKCSDPVGPKVLTWLHNYFVLGRVTDLKICPEVLNSNKDFSQKVLLTLKNEVKFGETITRQNLARLSGNPKGAQAAGSAVSDNPIHFVIPSHRVIKRDGSIGNYNKVTEIGITEWLIDFEKRLDHQVLEKKTEETSDTSDEE